jgi:alkylation response protein AidB-like acyl-CoA dehydrogenase
VAPERANRPSPLEAACQLAPQIRAASDQIDAARELPEDLVGAIADAGLFRMLVPRSYSGSELDLPNAAYAGPARAL